MSPKRLRLFSKEGELGPPVEQWLTEQGYDVYHEVDAPGGRADLVGLRAPLVCAVELKLSMTVDVLAQARNWLQYTNFCWIAVPTIHRDHSVRAVLRDYAAWKGIGILTVGSGFGAGMMVREELEPVFRRRVLAGLRNACKPEHKTYAKAGAAGGGHYTPFKGTCDRLRRYVNEHRARR